jgi:hypothetical protein
MDKFLESLVDNIGNIIIMIVVPVAIFAGYYAIESVNESVEKRQEETKQLTEACYAQGMVLVTTDAGQRCVLPQSLVKVK